MKMCAWAIAAVAAVGLGGVAHGASVLQIDVNSLSASAASGFGSGYSGAVQLSIDGDSTFNGMKVDGADQGVDLGVWSLAAFSGSASSASLVPRSQ